MRVFGEGDKIRVRRDRKDVRRVFCPQRFLTGVSGDGREIKDSNSTLLENVRIMTFCLSIRESWLKNHLRTSRLNRTRVTCR
jgi:hypothetical protein